MKERRECHEREEKCCCYKKGSVQWREKSLKRKDYLSNLNFFKEKGMYLEKNENKYNNIQWVLDICLLILNIDGEIVISNYNMHALIVVDLQKKACF